MTFSTPSAIINRSTTMVQRKPATKPPPSKVVQLIHDQDDNDDCHNAGNLQNEVHPLFARQNFPQGEVNYDALLPSLRLVSKLLEAPQVRHFLYVTWYGRNEKVGMKNARGVELEAYRSDRTIANLSPDDIAAVETKLLALAKMVTFHVSDQFKGSKNGWCMALPPPAVPGLSRPTGTLPGDLPGVNSRIYLSSIWYDAVTVPPGPQRDYRSYRNDCFAVAMTLLHEIAHAANYAAMGARPEDFFEDSLIAEAGFEIVARLFGAVYRRSPTGLVGYLYEWPSNPLLRPYDGKLACRDPEGVPMKCFRWRMQDHLVYAMFHDWFWAWAEEEGPLAFVPDGVVHAVQETLENGERVPVPKSIVDLITGRDRVLSPLPEASEPRTARRTVAMRERQKKAEEWARPKVSERQAHGAGMLPELPKERVSSEQPQDGAGETARACDCAATMDGDEDDVIMW